MLISYPQPDIYARHIYSLHVNSQEDIPADLTLPGPLFACLLACDATNYTDDAIRRAAELLMDRGLASFCAWGPGCSWVHDLFDLTIVTRSPADNPGLFIPTTWHEDQSLDEALWFLFYCASPDPDRWDKCQSALVITVSYPELEAHVRFRLANLEQLSRDVVED